ncbi:hypothetical protein BDP27DRAFT_1433866 [Rhodocollybia butyracea]|uniref:Uncharacterized protein n=1 Tax=Rhodocollybia butyracea TaxID=206335 RepID=A0A9P5TWL0_9AGAR|nr:hypothetical protein BDP27DRAFT_1433866 [Rhodocollybia butyracea]
MYDIPSNPSSPAELELECWNLLLTYTTTDLSFPVIEQQLRDVYHGTTIPYNDLKWRPTLKAVLQIKDPEGGKLSNIISRINHEMELLSVQIYTINSPPSMESPSYAMSSPPHPSTNDLLLLDFRIDPALLFLHPPSPPKSDSDPLNLSLVQPPPPATSKHPLVKWSLLEYAARKQQHDLGAVPAPTSPVLQNSLAVSPPSGSVTISGFSDANVHDASSSKEAKVKPVSFMFTSGKV